MSMNWQDFTTTAVGAVFVSALAAVGWLIRVVFTNHKQLALMRQEYQNSQEMRKRDREDIQAMKETLLRFEDKLDRLSK